MVCLTHVNAMMDTNKMGTNAVKTMMTTVSEIHWLIGPKNFKIAVEIFIRLFLVL